MPAPAKRLGKGATRSVEEMKKRVEPAPAAPSGGTAIPTSPFGTSTLTVPALPAPTSDPAERSPFRQDLAVWFAAWLVDEKFYDPTLAAGRGRVLAALHGADFEANPDLLELSSKSGNVAWAALELDGLFRNVFNWEEDLATRLNAASSDQIAEWDMSLRSVERRLAQEDAHRTMIQEVTRPAVEGLGLDLEGLEKKAAILSIGAGVTGVKQEGPQRALHFVNRVTGLPLSWQTTNTDLAASVETEDGEFLYRLRLDEPIGDSPLAAMVAITQALAGTKHSIIRADELPGRQMFLGNIWEFVGDVTGPAFRGIDNVNHVVNWYLNENLVPSAQKFREEHQRKVDLAYSEAEIDGDNMIILAAASLAGDGSVTLEDVAEANELFSQVSAEQRDIIAGELSPSRDFVEDALEDLVDDRHSAKRFLDASAAKFAEAASYW